MSLERPSHLYKTVRHAETTRHLNLILIHMKSRQQHVRPQDIIPGPCFYTGETMVAPKDGAWDFIPNLDLAP